MTTKREKLAWVEPFLESLAKTGNVRLSCMFAEVSRKVAYERKSKDAGFSEKWDDAIDESTDILEQECRRRAIEGVERVKWLRAGNDENGKPLFEKIVEREYSDNLLMFLMKGNRPDKWRDTFDLRAMVAAVASVQESADGRDARAAKAARRKRPS